jgi:hypothetical protein
MTIARMETEECMSAKERTDRLLPIVIESYKLMFLPNRPILRTEAVLPQWK